MQPPPLLLLDALELVVLVVLVEVDALVLVEVDALVLVEVDALVLVEAIVPPAPSEPVEAVVLPPFPPVEL